MPVEDENVECLVGEVPIESGTGASLVGAGSSLEDGAGTTVAVNTSQCFCGSRGG